MAVLLALLLGCDGGVLPGTTVRSGTQEQTAGSELELRVFEDEGDCVAGGVEDSSIGGCTPWVGRGAGEVRLGFQTRWDGQPFPLPLSSEHVKVIHQGAEVLHGQSGMQVELVPHDPRPANQLFVLVIDGSGSMNEVDADGVSRIDKVRRSLLKERVVDGFFPEDKSVKTGVILLTFTESVRPVGGELQVLRDRRSFRQLVRNDLSTLGGWTHLYDAVEYATGDLMQEELVAQWLGANDALPTVVVLTDGFNNEQASDTCGDNASRLSELLEHLQTVRRGQKIDMRQRPSVYSVGLGRPVGARITLDADELQQSEVKKRTLCGKRVGMRIDGDLERYGIDKVSLDWIAASGGGFSFVKQDPEGLAEAFAGAAAERYRWFELRYRVDPFYLRRAFTTKVRLDAFANAEASLRFEPSGWLDAPGGEPRDDGWSEPVPFRRTAALVLPVIAALLGIAYGNAALYNAFRALFRRRRRR